MVDSSVPLLSQSSSVHPSDPIASLDETIEQFIGSFSWTQLLQAFVVSFGWAFDAQQAFISMFTDHVPTWHRTQLGDVSCNNSAKADPCKIPRSSWTWDEPVQASIISEWDLACANPFITGLPTSSFFVGCLIGGLVLATLADSSLGRKNMLVAACLTMSLAGASTVFSPNIWVYSCLRFISGFGRGTIGTCAIVLSSELVGKRWRGQVGIMGFFCFPIGFLSLPCIAYTKSLSSYSWRTIYLWTSIPAICYSVLVHFMVHESPRWLLIQGRKEEALKTLQSIASCTSNNSTMMLVSLFNKLGTGDAAPQKETWSSRIKMLWDNKWALRRLIVVMTVGIGIGMVYYGMPLGLNNLSFDNLYLSMTFNALSELPASLITFCLIGRLNRRSAISVLSVVSGVSSIMCVLVVNNKGIQIGMELLSFFTACTGLNVLLIYNLELFPTCVRNSAMSLLRQAIVLGGVFSPVMVAAAGRENGKLFLSYGVFGIVIGCCGLFVCCLPETKEGKLCDTMDEQDKSCCCCVSFDSQFLVL